MEQTDAQKELKEANDALSQACFELGRQHHVVKQCERDLENAKVKFHNLEVDQDKAAQAYKRAFDRAQAEARRQTQAEESPQLEVVQ